MIMSEPVVDPWRQLRSSTQARIGLGRSGHALPTSALLAFQSAHALARDAVHTELDVADLNSQLEVPAVVVHSAAPDRATYLQRPDLGRQLAPEGRTLLAKVDCDVVFVLADGLSSQAVSQHAVPLLNATVALLPGWSIGPTVIARQARVALGDEVAALLGAPMVVVLIGERPGLSASDSLGVYLTYEPRPGRRDSERNCISNVRPPIGHSIAEASQTLSRLMISARRLKLTGTGLRDDAASIDPSADVLEIS
jgi:ethanolamine ammonia-lyase small subunit